MSGFRGYHRKIRFDIVTSFFLLISATIAAIIFFTIRGYQDSVYSFTKQFARDLSISITSQVANHFTSISSLINTIEGAVDDSTDIFSDERVKKIYTAVILENPSILSVYLTNPEGQFFQARNMSQGGDYQNKVKGKIPENVVLAARMMMSTEGKSLEQWTYYDKNVVEVSKEELEGAIFNPLRRDWYVQAEQRRKGVWSDAYVFKTSKMLGITYSLPVLSKKGGTFLGVVAVDMTIDSLNKFLQNIRFSPNARLYILNNKNEIIASSQQTDDSLKAIQEGKVLSVEQTEDKVLKKALQQAIMNEKEFSVFRFQAEEYIGNVRNFSDEVNNLRLIILAPSSDFISYFTETLQRTFIIAGIMFLISVILIYYLAIQISRPLSRLAAEAKKIEQLKLDKFEPIRSNIEEISTLAKTIESLHKSIGVFSKFLPKDLVYKLLHRNEPIVLGGANDNLTIMFTDIADFTKISERFPAEYIMQHISDYFDNMSRVIMKHKGTIDKYIGDAIMAIWGAPNHDTNQAINACFAALACQTRLSSLNDTWAQLNKPAFFTRIGIHSGNVVVGNMGSQDRMNYTVIGDSVNIASRIEGMNKVYGTQILASESVVEKAERYFLFRLVDKVALKGKQHSLKIYELVSTLDEKNENMREKKLYCTEARDAFEDYTARNWDRAIHKYNALRKNYAWGQKAAEIMIDRCRHFKRRPPESGWDGSVYMDQK